MCSILWSAVGAAAPTPPVSTGIQSWAALQGGVGITTASQHSKKCRELRLLQPRAPALGLFAQGSSCGQLQAARSKCLPWPGVGTMPAMSQRDATVKLLQEIFPCQCHLLLASGCCHNGPVSPCRALRDNVLRTVKSHSLEGLFLLKHL